MSTYINLSLYSNIYSSNQSLDDDNLQCQCTELNDINKLISLLTTTHNLDKQWESTIINDLDYIYKQIELYKQQYDIIQKSFEEFKLSYNAYVIHMNNFCSNIIIASNEESTTNKMITLVNQQFKKFNDLIIYMSTISNTFKINLSYIENIRKIIKTSTIQCSTESTTNICITPNTLYNLMIIMINIIEKVSHIKQISINYLLLMRKAQNIIKDNLPF